MFGIEAWKLRPFRAKFNLEGRRFPRALPWAVACGAFGAVVERKVGTHDKAIVSIIAAIRGLTESPKQESRAIGFRAKREVEDDTEPKQLGRRARKK